MKKILITLGVLPFFLSGCANYQLRAAHQLEGNENNVIAKIREARTANIQPNDTYYSPKLSCVGEKMSEVLHGDPAHFVRISVAPIFDKTSKVFPQGSTAISEYVLHSLSRVKGFRLVETPLGYTTMESRNSFNGDNSPFSYYKNPQFLNGFASPPVGVAFPAQYYIAGSLTQYDEFSEIGNPNWSFNADIVQGKRSMTTISVALNLRIVNAATGQVMLSDSGKSASVYLSSRLYKIQTGLNVFKLISTKPYGVDYSTDVSDPTHYAIQEIVERALYELLANNILPTKVEC